MTIFRHTKFVRNMSIREGSGAALECGELATVGISKRRVRIEPLRQLGGLSISCKRLGVARHLMPTEPSEFHFRDVASMAMSPNILLPRWTGHMATPISMGHGLEFWTGSRPAAEGSVDTRVDGNRDRAGTYRTALPVSRIFDIER